jgi:hypothetical protein
MTNPIYISLVEQLLPTLPPNTPHGILVASMLVTLRRLWGDQPQEIVDCLDRELSNALCVLREREKNLGRVN